MYKLLLVDDFFVERENVKDIIDESEVELQVIGECSNGQEALEAIELLKPDFVLADIEMPFMNGLELAEQVKKKYPEIKFIFFSFYDKFEYAKKAIDLEAYAYILKPIVRDEMVASLQKMIDERKLEEKKREEDSELKRLLEQSKPLLIEKFKRELILGQNQSEEQIWERAAYFNLKVVRGLYQILTIEMDHDESILNIKDYEKKEMRFIYTAQMIESICMQHNSCICTRIDDRHWSVLCFLAEQNPYMLQEMTGNIASDIITRLQNSGVSVSVGLSAVFQDIVNSRTMYEQTLHILSFKFNKGKGQIIRAEDIEGETEDVKIELDEIQKDIRNIIGSGQKSLVDDYLDGLFLRLGTHSSKETVRNICFSIMLCSQLTLNEFNINLEQVFGKEQLIWEKLMRFESILDVKQWLRNVLLSMLEYIAEKSGSQARKIIDQAREYIERNYNRGITVKSIAESLYYNANYLNNLFKQETGETILEYITKIRMEKAKSLLEDVTRKLYEISVEVGYSHESYFKNVFKQYTGMSPKEFREKMQKR